MFKEVLREHYLHLHTRKCACGEYVLESSKSGYDPYLEHLNEVLMAEMPADVLNYWKYMEGEGIA